MCKRFGINSAVSVIGLFFSLLCHAQNNSEVLVSVRQEQVSQGRVIYQYKVFNNNERSIVAIAVGSNYHLGTSDLVENPIGWTFEKGIPPENVTSPSGWGANVIVTEENPYIELHWRNDGTADIPPNGVQSGYGVALAKPDTSYINGHWTVFFSDATAASGKLALEGTPRITIEAYDLSSATPGIWNISLQLSNTGTGDAEDVILNNITCRTLVGKGIVIVESPVLPLPLGRLGAGTSTTVSLELRVPTGIQKCALSQNGSLLTTELKKASFSSSQVVYPKLP